MAVLTPLDVTALNNAFSPKVAKVAREQSAPGAYAVDLYVHVTGTLDIAEDTEKTPTVSIPLKEVLALFVARAGGTRERSMNLLRECMADALERDVRGVGAIIDTVAIDAVYKEQVEAMVKTLPKTPVKGAVRAKLSVEKVDTGIDAGGSGNRKTGTRQVTLVDLVRLSRRSR
jgi:hypothetical protein